GCKSSGTLCKAYVSGSTQSSAAEGFPATAHAFQTALNATNGKSNATFLVVHEDGQSLDYVTLYGGAGNGSNADAGASVAVDSSGNGYITGATFSSDLTTKNPAVASYNAGASSKQVSNVFVAEFNPSAASGAASLLYATYLGGSGATGTISLGPIKIASLSLGDVATAVRIDPVTGHVWVAGATASIDFQVPGKVSPVFESTNQAGAAANAGSPATAGFITELDISKAGLNQVRYSTYFGGGGLKITELGTTGSIGVGDAIVDLETTGTLVYVTGATASGTVPDGFPLSASACQTLNNSAGILFGGVVDVPITAFAAQLDPSQSTSPAQLVFSTLLGGTGTADAGTGLAIDGFGDMLISGLTYSSDFPVTTTAFQGANNATGNSATNAFLTVLYPAGTLCTNGGGTPVPTPSSTPTPAATPTPGGKIAVSTLSLTLPPAGVGGAPTKGSFTIQNTSAKHHLVGNVGSPPLPFSIISGGGAFDLPPVSAPMTVKIRFTPTTRGPQAGSVVITSNDLADSSVTVNLKGAGKPGVPSLAIPSLSEPPNPLGMTFGPVGIGIPPSSITLKIHNIGLGALGGTIAALSAPFAVTSPLVFGPIAPGGVQGVTVQFTPTAVWLQSTTLVITTTNPNPGLHVLNVPVSGVGKPGVLTTTLAPLGETLSFGAVSHTGAPKVLSFKIQNIGKGELAGNVPALGGTFSVTGNSGAFALPPGTAKKITVQFAPPSTGPFNAPLAITVTPPGKPAAGITVTLKGKGT
ncbi:MAG TPA: choice-of-anchor D domain-containing protein, partial [Candidatus Cybelea sp.]